MSDIKTMKDFISAAKSQIEEVEIHDVEALLLEGYQVLDVREPAEYEKGSIQGAINVPRGVLEGAADLVVKGREELQASSARGAEDYRCDCSRSRPRGARRGVRHRLGGR